MSQPTGTREWAPHSLNIQRGCEHDCRYCYARYNAVCRFRRCTDKEWFEPVINHRKVDAHYGKKDGVIMYPTCHDITHRNINEYLCVLHKLLDAGNQVLIVSKPHWQCIPFICEAYKEYQRQITFRFTIGSTDDAVLRFWEPNGPTFNERLACLEYAYIAGYITSVSCEPFLDEFILDVYDATAKYITDSFWLGKLRRFDQRVRLDGVTDEQKATFVEPLRRLQRDDFILALVGHLKNKPNLKFKDSIREVLERCGRSK